jgi:RNA polymerase sigma-70 factor (ECF subfamily)
MSKNNLHPVQGPNDQWLIDIYNEEFTSLKGFALKLTGDELEAEEIVGHSLAKLAEKINDAPGHITSYTHAKAYLATIVRNACYDYLAKRGKVTQLEAAEAIPDETLLLELEKRDFREHLLTLIEQLPDQLREVINLFFREGCTIEEVEERLGLSKSVIYVYKTRAIKRLREIMDGPPSPPSDPPIPPVAPTSPASPAGDLLPPSTGGVSARFRSLFSHSGKNILSSLLRKCFMRSITYKSITIIKTL